MPNSQVNRVLVYAHYNQFGRLADYVVEQIRLLDATFDTIVFVSNSPLSEIDQEKLVDVTKIITRPNIGFDFAAWRDGLKYLMANPEVWDSASSLTIMNDTCFGPTAPLEPIFSSMAAADFDFWGLTNHRAIDGVQIGDEIVSVPEHLQSYFITFTPKVFKSNAFANFWDAVSDGSDVHHVIRSLELKLTDQLAQAGFSYGAAFDTRELDYHHSHTPNFPHYLPEVLQSAGMPFTKIKSFNFVPEFAPFGIDHLTRAGLPIEPISSHLSQLGEPDDRLFLATKQRDYQRAYLRANPVTEATDLAPNQPSVAIHLHVHCPELLPEFLRIFQTYHFPYSLFITVNSENQALVETALAASHMSAEIITVPNLGRDIYPLIQIADRLNHFDIIGHFHTKKSAPEREFIGASWRQELEDMLVKPADAIVDDFAKHPGLGIVIANMPTMFRYQRFITPESEAGLAPVLNNLWARMDMPRIIDFANRSRYVMSYGTFFWARPAAIKQILKLDIADEIPGEPLGRNTVLHALERILIYVAWGNGYDYRISEGRYLTSFVELPGPAPVQSTYWKLRGKASAALPPTLRLKLKKLRDRRW